MSWRSGSARSILIFAYFVVFTVWVPSWLIEVEQVAKLNSLIKDFIAVASWGGFLVFGILALRSAQKRGWI